MSHVCERCGRSDAVEFEHVSVSANGVSILTDINAGFPQGGCTAIVGPNGAGKTTLVLALLDEIAFDGKILFHGFREARPKIGYVPQQLAFDRGMPLTVMEFMTAFHQKRPLCLGIPKQLREKMRSLLADTCCSHLEKRPLGALSGGELQRVMLAAALSQDPELLILDEPASGMDFKGGEVCCELLEKFRKQRGFTQLMISHDLSTVAAHATHVLCLNKTVCAYGEPQDVLTDAVLAATFGPHRGTTETNKIHGHECHCCGGSKHAD